MMQQKVLFVDHAPRIGGSTRVLLQLLGHLKGTDIIPVVVCPPDSRGYFEDKGLFVETTPMPWFTKRAGLIGLLSYIYYLISVAFFLRKMIRKYDIAFIHANGFIAALYSVIPAKTKKRPLLWHMHDILEPGTFNGIFIRIAGWAADRIVCVSRAVRNRLVEFGVAGKKCKVIYNSMPGPAVSETDTRGNFREEFGIPPETRLIGMVGNICRLKGQLVLLEAIPEITQLFPAIRFVVVGDINHESDRSYKVELDRFVKDHDLEQMVIFTGFRSDALLIISSFDIVVHPNVLPDSFPSVLLEALHERKPVIASNIGGIPEMIVQGVNGLLVQPGDSHGLASAVCHLLSDPALMQVMGTEGKQMVLKNFTPELFFHEFSEIYRELLGRL